MKIDAQEQQYLTHLALDLYLFETVELDVAPLVWTVDADEDPETATERIWHFQAQGHARVGAWVTRSLLGVPSKSFRVAPDSPYEATWDGAIRSLMSFSKSILTPVADLETGFNATLVAAVSARRLQEYIVTKPSLLDDIRLKITLNTYTHMHSMMLMYRNHPTFMDKVAAQKLEKMLIQFKRNFENYAHKSVASDVFEQGALLANTGFSQLLGATRQN